MSNTSMTASTNHASHIVSDDWLTRQDEYYVERRLPAPTAPGAEDRTFCFRVEFEHDLLPLKAMLQWAIETWWSSPICPFGDADAKVTLKPNTLSLHEIRWLFDRVSDCHVAMQTVALEALYNGERSYLEAAEMGVEVPNAHALRKSLPGVAAWRDALSANADRAFEAQLQIKAALDGLKTSRARSKSAARD